MKKWLIVLMCLLISGCATVPEMAIMSFKPNYDFSYIKRVAVLPFGSRETVSDYFATLVTSVAKFDIVERGQLDKILEEQKLGLSGLLDDKTRRELGRLLGVDAIFVGSAETTEHPYYRGGSYYQGTTITSPKAGVNYYTTVNVRLVDIETGDVLISCSDGSWDAGGDLAVLRIIEQLQRIKSLFYTKTEFYEMGKRKIIDTYLAGDKKKAKRLEKEFGIKVKRSDTKRAKPFKNEPDGFRGIKWGTDISSLSDMNYIEDFSTLALPIEGISTLNLKVYTRKSDELQIGGAQLEEILYLCYKNELSTVRIITNGLANFRALKDAIFMEFGKGQPLNEYAEGWIWLGETAIVALAYEESSKTGFLSLISTKYFNKIERQIRIDQKQKAKKGAEKGF